MVDRVCAKPSSNADCSHCGNNPANGVQLNLLDGNEPFEPKLMGEGAERWCPQYHPMVAAIPNDLSCPECGAMIECGGRPANVLFSCDCGVELAADDADITRLVVAEPEMDGDCDDDA